MVGICGAGDPEEVDEMDGCCFADAPLLRVSAVTGEGIEKTDRETITRTAIQIAGENGTAFGTRDSGCLW